VIEKRKEEKFNLAAESHKPDVGKLTKKKENGGKSQNLGNREPTVEATGKGRRKKGTNRVKFVPLSFKYKGPRKTGHLKRPTTPRK